MELEVEELELETGESVLVRCWKRLGGRGDDLCEIKGGCRGLEFERECDDGEGLGDKAGNDFMRLQTRVYVGVKGNLNKVGQELEPEMNICASTKMPGLEDEYMRLKKDT
ncbi:hypothetical protein K443DRAFT_126184 [Laccaria amethystina LaAM-08-1]|uniref:Uncharacterized protein n=1 Tax=Laccaria amethystina LaAM-08-1 TaxID=1095629 RepID=A0A0C9WTM2_9AGAR|nr:hypothetical protein K443DRAFT_126184 [Laccaria amethystina LaAM-08-1]